MMKLLGCFTLLVLVQLASSAADLKDFPESLQKAVPVWREKCYLLFGDKHEDVEEAKKGNIKDSLKDYVACLWLISGVMTEKFELRTELSSYLPPALAPAAAGYMKCAAESKDLAGKTFSEKVLEMTKCNYKRDPANFLIF